MPNSIDRFMAYEDELILDPTKRELAPEKGDKGFSIGRVKAGGVSEENRTVTGVLSTPSVDRYEEIVEPAAFKEWLPRFMSDNPKFLPNHSHGGGGGMPSSIGHWESLNIQEDALVGTAKFLPSGDPLKLADAWWFRFLHGSQRTFSVAWITHAWEMREFELGQGVKKNIRVFTEVELIEISAVEIPANRDATLIRAAAFRAGLIEAAALDDHKSGVADAVRELLPHLSPDAQRALVKDVLIQTLTDPDGPLPLLIEETVQQTVAALGYGEGSDGLTPGSGGSRSGPPTQEPADAFGASVFGQTHPRRGDRTHHSITGNRPMPTMTEHEKKFTDSMKEVAAEGKTFTEAVKSIVAEIDDVKKVPDAVKAIETLQAERKSGNEDVLNRVRRVEQRVNNGGQYRGNFGSEDTARAAGLHVLRETAPDTQRRTRADEALKSDHKDYHERAQTAGSLQGGGALVVPEVQTALERAEHEHGVAKQRLTRKTMNSDSYSLAVRKGRPKVYLWGEGKVPTESEMNLDKVSLKVQNWATLGFYPLTLDADSATNIGEELIDWFGEGFSYQFDYIAYVGDGGADSFGKRGVIPKWLQMNKTAVEDVDTNDYANLTEDHFLSMMAKVTNASYANGRWSVSAFFYFTVMVPIQLSKGGVTYAEMRDGFQPMFLGKPVDFAEVISPTAVYKDHANADHRAPCAFGDLGRAGAWADRQQVGFASNENVKWLEGQVAVMGVERTDVNFFDGVETVEGKSAMSVLKVNPAA